MFYSTQILARNGPLGLVWLAAHMERQLRKGQVADTSIPVTVDALLDPNAPLALRLSGQLMLGVVRIYARKVAYLHQDCQEILVRIRIDLRPLGAAAAAEGEAGGVALRDHTSAAHHVITLPDIVMDELELAWASQGGGP
ncbi:MAG: hypothetical protein WDW36_008378 [Sanguina aurantia]